MAAYVYQQGACAQQADEVSSIGEVKIGDAFRDYFVDAFHVGEPFARVVQQGVEAGFGRAPDRVRTVVERAASMRWTTKRIRSFRNCL